MSPQSLAGPDSLFSRLKETCKADWSAFVEHEFTRRLGDGSLPEACYRHYLAQDYIFLIHFSRAYALAVYKSEDLDDMRQAAITLDALLNTEMSLHIRTCAKWGLTEADIMALPEATENLAYTRFVLDKGSAGDLLDLLIALAPCVVGYGEIGLRLSGQGAGQGAGPASDNPYREWIETYSGQEYQEVAQAAVRQLDRVAARRLGPGAEAEGRWASLCKTFQTATRLEIGFWDMGLEPAGRAQT